MVHFAETTNPWGGHSFVSDHTLYEKNPSPPAGTDLGPGSGNRSSLNTKLFHSSLFDIGILRDTLLPSLTLHTGLSLVAYGAGRYTNRLESKDWLWPSGQVLNAWWSALGKRVFLDGIPLSSAWAIIDRPQRLLLTGVTLWGSRLFWRVASRSVKRGNGKDDPRYEVVKKQSGWSWNQALFTTYLPEAVFQSLITLPFTAPFRHLAGSDRPFSSLSGGYAAIGQAIAVGLFSMGFALEVLADWQLEQFKEKEKSGKEDHSHMCREGVWSIVRHPK